MIKYTKEEIWAAADNASADMSLFYTAPFVNYTGRTSDTNEPYTEAAAAWCLANLDRFETIRPITREASYRIETHAATPPTEDSPREEENIAMAIRRQGSLPFVGNILDYQVPLKNVRDDKAGTIDLISHDAGRGRLLLLELKRPSSPETMLRCLLEGYTYLRIVDGRKLLADFGLPEDTTISSHPLIFLHSSQFMEMTQDRPNMKRLADALNSRPYYLTEFADNTYSVL